MTSSSVAGQVQREVSVQSERQRAQDRPDGLDPRERVQERVQQESLDGRGTRVQRVSLDRRATRDRRELLDLSVRRASQV